MISLVPLTRGVYPYDFFTHSKRFKKATTTTRGGDGDGDDDARVFYRVSYCCVLLIWSSRETTRLRFLSLSRRLRKNKKFHI